MTSPTNDDPDREASAPPPSSEWGPPQTSASGWSPPQWAPPTAAGPEQYPSAPGQWDQPTQQEQPWPQPYAGGSDPPWAGQPPGQGFGGPPRSKSNRKLFAILAAVVAVVLVGGGLFFFLSGEDITYQGRDIVEPEKVLGDAESSLDGIVEQRNGATNDETSCYFVVRNADTTDIEDRLACGPVLFVDGDEGQLYLSFPLEASAGDGDARLTVAAEPASPEPAELADPELLVRPDGAAPPDGSGGLAVPEPPRAEAGLFSAIPSDGTDLESTPSTARIGSPTMSIDVTGIGGPERYGQGDDARRPAEGEKFVAFEVASGPGEIGPIADFSVAVQVDDEDPAPFPGDADLSSGPVVLAISVPEDTDDVSLVVTEGPLVQRLSLITGEPDPGNIAVWQRANRSQVLTFSQPLTVRLSQPGFVTEDFASTLAVNQVVLAYFPGPNSARAPSAPSQAFLVLDSMVVVEGQEVQFEPVFWSLTLADGTVLPALNLSDDPDEVLIGFDVPAGFTEGMLNLGGVSTDPSGLTIDLLGAVATIPVAIPEG